jgi:3-oxoadipate enol-lactonase
MLAEDVVALLAALAIPRTHFVGLSMGGMIGQTLALEHPELLASLVLADTASRIPPEMGPIWDLRVATAMSRGMAVSADDTIARWFTAPFIAGSPEVVDHIRSLIRTTAPTGFAGCCRAIQHLDATDRLGEIELPTLIIVGENDPGTPVAVSELMHQRIAGSKLVVIGPAAHLSNVEQAEKFNRALRSFLDRL